jgi:dipeptidase E
MISPESRVYCIGGGNPRDPRMAEHFENIVDLAREKFSVERAPRIALLPTAHRNGTHPKLQALDFIESEFARNGCSVDRILIGDLPAGQSETTKEEVSRILQDADALFVLGGDTRYMLEILREKELVPTFEQSLKSGVVFSGSSAGTIWLAEEAMSDSESFTTPVGWDFIMLKGVGVLPFVMNVHDDQGIPSGVATQVVRKEQFEEQFLKFENRFGLAVDEFVGLEMRGGRCVVHSPSVDKGAYLLGKVDGTVLRRKIDSPIDLNDADAISGLIKGTK